MRKKRFDSKGKQRRKLTREDEAAWRLTHLWAASHVVASACPTLSRFYVATTRQICRRINLKADSVTIKRAVCKKCNSLLVPGVGASPPTIRHATAREKHLVVTCGHCGAVRRFLSRPPAPTSAQVRRARGTAQAPTAAALTAKAAETPPATTKPARSCSLQ